MFIQSFKIIGLGIAQIAILAAIGFICVRKGILKQAGVDFLSRLVVELTLPLLIFCQMIRQFSFKQYPNWWMFPLLSVAIMLAGFIVGSAFSVFVKGSQEKLQFITLNMFSNCGYLPLVLFTALFAKGQLDTMLVYLFLFLLGFNSVVWSFGVYMLTFTKEKRFELKSFLSPPVVATVLGLLFVYFKLGPFIPDVIYKPLKMVGDCTTPLAMFIVSAAIAQIRLSRIDKGPVLLALLAKLIILPAIGIFFIVRFNIYGALGLFIVLQFAVPPATSLAVILAHYKKEDFLIGEGIFFGHILSLITIPVFLSIYFMLAGGSF